jgi:curli biogenesis system outer membrane secretion channel CsgG
MTRRLSGAYAGGMRRIVMSCTMRCLLACGVLVAGPVRPAAAQRQEIAPSSNRPAVAVAEFETDRTAWMPPPQLGLTLAELLADRLVESGQFRVMESGWLAEPGEGRPRLPPGVLRERAERAGIEYLVLGSVTRFSSEKKQHGLGGAGLVSPIFFGHHGSQTESVIGLTLRVVHVRTGEVVATATSEGSASRRSISLGALGAMAMRPGGFGFSSGASNSREALVDEAVQDALAAASASLIKSAARLRTAPSRTAAASELPVRHRLGPIFVWP